MIRLTIVVSVAALLAIGPAPAAGTKPAQAPAAAPAPPTQEPPPPYEPQLLRLAELTGALAYLRDLCGAGDGSQFRSKMEKLLAAEGLSDSRRDLLAGAYNRGFRDYETTYRTCTPVADKVIAKLLGETARLAAEVTGRFGS
ncbi:MAG TPA: TIGR02301 family protein [Roseiarcus sp.]|nr:TIGR02301 family protein [Roseiarcus sp.]